MLCFRRFGPSALCPVLAALLLASCGGGAANVDVDEVTEQETVVLGRVVVYYQGEMVSGTTTVYAAGPTEARLDAESYQVGRDGAVVWKMKRPYGELRLRWARVTSQNESSALELGENSPLLHPPDVQHDVYYFGTLVLVIGEEIPDAVSDYDFVERSRVVHVAHEDRADETLSLLAKEHESIRGEQYYNVPRGTMAQAPMGK